jgi:methylphosphotriester-DNA--protein-cysteine methyltransferase
MANKRKGKAPKMSPSTRRRIREAEGRMQQGQISTDADLDAVTQEMRKNERNSGLKVNSGFPSFEEFRDSGGGMKNGGRVRGSGIARKGIRECKMR